MIPVVMSAVNASTLSSHFLTLLCLIVTYPSFEHFPVTYLLMVVARAALLTAGERDRVSRMPLASMIYFSVVAHLALSLLINILTTSIIAFKAWYVRIDGV